MLDHELRVRFERAYESSMSSVEYQFDEKHVLEACFHQLL